MRPVLFVTALSLVVTGCATIESESIGEVVVNGRSYELRTRTLNGPNGTYESSHVVVRGNTEVCRPQSPGDCEAAVRRAQNQFRDRNT